MDLSLEPPKHQGQEAIEAKEWVVVQLSSPEGELEVGFGFN